MAVALTQINWQAPWLQPWRSLGEPIAQAVMAGQPVPTALNDASAHTANRACPVRFVPQSDLPAGQAYEDFIFRHQACPTRDGLHDFFNGLCWLHMPLSKSRLNQLQAEQIALQEGQAQRGPVRDALTVFDENAALLLAPPALWQALLDRDWQRLFVALRPLWQEAQLLLFGHALLEKLVTPRKAITAHVYRPSADASFPTSLVALAALDQALAADLNAARLASKPFTPLPVLGVPGWWADNQHPGFYTDAGVFRPSRI